MGASQHHNISWIKVSVFFCFIILCGTLFYVYNMDDTNTASNELYQFAIDDIKVHMPYVKKRSCTYVIPILISGTQGFYGKLFSVYNGC